MASNDIINPVGINNPSNTRRSVDLLPGYIRTDKNTKFLSSTLDQLIQQPQLKRIDGFIGSQLTPTYKSTDTYLNTGTTVRDIYQLAPSLVVKDANKNIQMALGYDDLINELAVNGAKVNNLDRLFRSSSYSYDPQIDWDKFVNFRQYYWMPTGPESVLITGQARNTISTYSVKDAADGNSLLFTPDGLTTDPLLVLYRGLTYVFNVKSDYPFYVKTAYVSGAQDLYSGASNQGTVDGQVTVTIDEFTPSHLFYFAEGNPNAIGQFAVKSLTENTVLDVETDIIGKKTYTSGNGVAFSNGMKVHFVGSVSPASYVGKDYIIEGVGKAIALVPYDSLKTVGSTTSNLNPNFDATPFDLYPFDDFSFIPLTPEYVTINRAAPDLNSWSRYNRWVHTDVIAASAAANGTVPVYDSTMRAQRPIVEFVAGLQLFNFGARAKNNIDLIDTITKSAFNSVEGSAGFYIDGVLVEQGFRVIFNADTDPDVRGRIYEVKFTIINNKTVINLEEAVDSEPTYLNAVVAIRGNTLKGSNWWYNGSKWEYGQQKTSLNQFPIFDVFDDNGVSYSDQTIYNSTFVGTKLFAYAVGKGTPDTVLGFPLQYKNVSNVGDYLFNNHFMTDTFTNFTTNNVVQILNVGSGYLKINSTNGETYCNSWTKSIDQPIPLVQSSTGNEYYDLPINLTNNPLNGPISNFTFTELSDHVASIVKNTNQFIGTFPGAGNLRDLSDSSAYGTRLISNGNPISFAHYFLGSQKHNVIDAIRKAAYDYGQFKSTLIKQITNLKGLYTPAESLDIALTAINVNQHPTSSYQYSDMLAYGTTNVTRTYTVTDSRNKNYSLISVFDDTVLSERAVLVYLNDVILVKGHDYVINKYDPSITISVDLVKGDIIKVLDYSSTVGSYIAPTPTKLGLYPKFKPSMYYDDTYVAAPQLVIQGHDGSITVAYGDYRDAVLLEYETRIYNNLKVNYNSELLNITSLTPGAFRTNLFSSSEYTSLFAADFLNWTGVNGVDYITNDSFNQLNGFTYNYSGNVDTLTGTPLVGYWRNVYKYYYDTDRPHSHPWEMLGFTEMPAWWETTYGSAPYTSGNQILWDDLEAGRDASTGAINLLYARPGLSAILPVDELGNLLNPTDTGLATTPAVDLNNPNRTVVLSSAQITNNWNIGDHAPAETAWRRSSYWPFVNQILLALQNPATYASVLFDTSRMRKNVVGQYKYDPAEFFLNPANVVLSRDIDTNGNRILTSGYSVWVIETGISNDVNYLSTIKNDLSNLDYNLMIKLGGFASKEKIQVTIDAVDPSSPYPGVLVPNEDYDIFFNQSSPVESLAISGLLIQKSATGYVIRGYDKFNPYFTIFQPIPSNADQIINVGGTSETFLGWTTNTTYPTGQIVFYGDRYYRTLVLHNSGDLFNKTNYQSLPYLPVTGGIQVLRRTRFENVETIVSYGVEYSDPQDVYDLIVGYGHWLESKGFVFEEFNTDLQQITDWAFTAKEFLYWSTQNWSVNSVITLSPFANKLILRSTDSVVDDILNKFDSYSLLKASGRPFPINNFSIVRLDGEFSITTVNTTDGLYFAQLNLVQKEHALVFNNYTIFNDVVYDIETGYRQLRVKLSGFITANWNGDFFSPGFIFDEAKIQDWEQFADYTIGDIVRFSGRYYTPLVSMSGTAAFDLTQWILLNGEPTPQLMPNFDYKINQFNDFYSLDIDNFDVGQQKMAQHLTGYTPRSYLNYIIGDPIAQYKFYQGYIKEKGTKNPLIKISKASLNNLQSSIDFDEEWAFRIGHYGGYNTYQELEFPLIASKFIENPQIIEFTETVPVDNTSANYYQTGANLVTTPDNFDITKVFATTSETVEDIFQLPVAGYVRFDDVTGTAYNTNSILDIANNAALIEGNTIWIGFKPNGDWDVLRVTQQPATIIAVAIYIPSQSLIVTTNSSHRLQIGDIISITDVSSSIDRCYIVQEIISSTQFIILSTLSSLPALPDILIGLLFSFTSSRAETFGDLADNRLLDKWNYGEKVWIDNNGSNRWSVYKKINNYQSVTYDNNLSNVGQHFGSKIVADGSTIVVAAPDYLDAVTNEQGRVFVLYKNTANAQPFLTFNYAINDNNGFYYNGTSPTKFGNSLIVDSTTGLIIAGAPYTSNVHSTATNYIVDITPTGNNYVNQGLVKLSLITPLGFSEFGQAVITTPNPQDNSLFGTSIAYSTLTNRLLVGSPGEQKVYVYDLTVTTSTVTVASNFTEYVTTSTTGNFGNAITGNDTLTLFAVSAPTYAAESSTGAVHIYNSLEHIQTITDIDLPTPIDSGIVFGKTIKMTPNGQYLIIGSPDAYDPLSATRSGVVDIFKFTNNLFVWSQRISAPFSDTGFGYDIAISKDGTTLVISAEFDSNASDTTFDIYSKLLTDSEYTNDPASPLRIYPTTIDESTTGFYSKIINAGAVHTYLLSGQKWVYAQQLKIAGLNSNSLYGHSVYITDNSVFVGAPGELISDYTNNGQIFIFDKINTLVNSWQEIRTQENLVDISLINRAMSIDTTTDQVLDYIEIIDPLKGKVLGTAQDELRYLTPYDPAIYSIGTSDVNVNPSSSWLDEHVGELWWDLSTVKYVWYEQGELEYRKNNWNRVFPGCTIDVYEWVKSEYLPADWSQIADTTNGLTKNISGQPKVANNTVLSVKQIFNTVSNSFSNVYYYWVKNKTTLPVDVANRRVSAYEVANQISNPVGQGVEFVAVISPTTLMLANYKSSVLTDNVNLNISSNLITDSANRHTEWVLLAENNPNSQPNGLLDKKLFDSLLGHDSLGNIVPDPSLPSRRRYGLGIRPRQGLFVDRLEALRNVIEYTNSVMSTELLTGIIDFTNLNTTDVIPEASTYDVLVEDIYNLELISSSVLSTAKLTATTDTAGRISSIAVTEPGFGYITPPIVRIIGTGVNAEITTAIDSYGRVTAVNVVNPGTGYTDDIILVVRPFTAVVQTDVNSNGKWTIYEWDQAQWNKVRTQQFDTTEYWKYIDWKSSSYNPLTIIVATISSPYELYTLMDAVLVGEYVKVQNGGDSRYLILRRTDGSSGTFDNDWDLVYSEKGTIQISDLLWNSLSILDGWDETVGYDQTRYDEGPDQELSYILNAIKEDIFIDARKIYWNTLFFKAVRYAMSEQTFLDWAFKTTFISATVTSGSLDQPATYKLQNSDYYEDFLKEIKPYHTKIRKFTEAFTSTEPTQTHTTDFDRPSYYNRNTSAFETVDIGNALLSEYPWKSWSDNNSYGIESIEIFDGGSGYTSQPLVHVVAAPGDTGTGATAIAYISLGKVNRIEVTNPGTDYTMTPTVVFNGGGDTQLTPARAYVRFTSSLVRATNVTMKFDRVSGQREIGNQYYTDTYTSDGERVTYPLTWVPIPDKFLITLKVNNVLQLIDSYTIEYTESAYSPQPNTSYIKKYATLRLLFVPKILDIVEITYPKNIELYTAFDRIQDYYSPTAGMPGNTATQLMSGLEYPGLVVETLPFGYAGGWDVLPFSSSPWDNYSSEDGYVAFSTTSTATQTFTFANTIFSTGTAINTYVNGQRIDTTISPTLYGAGTGQVDYVEVTIVGEGYTGTVSVSISAPNTIGGTPATAHAELSQDDRYSIVNVVVDNPGSGYTMPPVVSIRGINTVQAYATAVLKAEFTSSNNTSLQAEITILNTAFETTSSLVVFRYATSDGTVLPTDPDSFDSVIDGGNIEYTTALGITPSEMILDGDTFLSTYNSPAPEECVPGQIQESVGISVYTQPPESPPIISNKKYWISGVPTTYALGICPSNTDSVIALFNDVKLLASDYVIDYENNTFTFTSVSPRTGWLSLTSMQIGSIRLIDYQTFVTTATNFTFLSAAPFSNVGSNGTSSYVTINGVPGVIGEDYTITKYRNRAKFTFASSGTIQSYLFSGAVKSFSEIKEQIIIATSITNTFDLIQPPGVVGPFHSQVIVTKNGSRLNPPVTTYYEVTNGQVDFEISQSIKFASKSINLLSLEVYVNGEITSPTSLWRLNRTTNVISFYPERLTDGDVIAIVVKNGNEYLIENNQLVLTMASAVNDEYHVTTFTNHDPDAIQTNRFKGHADNRYELQRSVIDSAYVWVTYNGQPLTVDLDYKVDVNGFTVILRDGIFVSESDNVVITSFANSSNQTTAYRIFKDMLGRTHYKRLSVDNSTVLTEPLVATATSIIVENAGILTPPNVTVNRPGIILVDGERIEFFTINGNELGQLRRGTLGTMPKDVYAVGTPVIDQGTLQTMPFREFVQSTSTVITTSTQTTFDLSAYITFNTSTAYTDQVEIRYGGVPLLKPGLTTVIHNRDAGYDTPATSDTVVGAQFTITSTSSVLTLNFTPQAGVRLDVIARNSRVFGTAPLQFLLERPATLPDKYRYEQ